MAGSVLTVLPVLLLFLVAPALLYARAAGRQRQGMRRLAVLAALALLSAAPAPLFNDPMDMGGGLAGRRARTALPRPARRPAARRDALRFRPRVGLCVHAPPGRADPPAQLRNPLPHQGQRRAQRSAAQADRRRQCVVEDVAQLSPARRVAGSRRPGRRNRLRLGPDEDKTLRRADGIEFVVARNRDGGAGTHRHRRLRIVALPGAPVVPPRPRTAPTTRSRRSPRPPRAALSRAPSSASSPIGRWPAATAAKSPR